MLQRLCFVVGAVLLSGGIALASDARDEKPMAVRDVGADRFAAGGNVRISQPVAGDLFAAGGNVNVDAAARGDTVVAGGDVRVRSGVGQSLYAAGGRVTVEGVIDRGARVAGGQVEFGRQSVVGGNVSAAGGEVRIDGKVAGYVQASGGQVVINGTVGGDAEVTAGQIELGPDARIAGKLRYLSDSELRRDPAAQIGGGIERIELRGHAHERSAGRGVAGWLWTLGQMVLAAVVVAALPALSARIAQTAQSRPGWSLLAGFVALVSIPVAALLLLVTLIGAPLSLLVLALYFAVLVAGYAATGIALGDWGLRRFRAEAVTRAGWRIAAAVLGVLAIAVIGRVPFLGGLIVLLALLVGIGALLLALRPAAYSSLNTTSVS